MMPGLFAADGEHVVTDLVDGVVQMLQGFCDALLGHAVGQASGSLQAQADVEQAADNPFEQFLRVGNLFGGNSGAGEADEIVTPPGLGDVPDHGESEMAGRGRHRTEADLDRERGSVLAQPDQPGPGAHGPGPRCLRIICTVAAVGRPQLGGDERFDRLAEQFTVPIAEHVLKPPAGQRECAIIVGQRDSVGEGVDEVPQHGLGDGRSSGAPPRWSLPP